MEATGQHALALPLPEREARSFPDLDTVRAE